MIKFRLNHYIAILMASSIVLANASMGFADEEALVVETFDLGEGVVNEETEVAKIADFEESEGNILEKQQEFLKKLNEELNLSKSDYRQILNSISDTKNRLDEVNSERITLQREMQILDDQINLTTEKLFNVIKQVTETENEITIIYEEMEVKKTALEYQKVLLSDYIQILYREENELFSFDKNGKIDTFKLLLAEGSVGDNLKELKYFTLLNEAGTQMVDRLGELEKELEKGQTKLEEKHAKLSKLQAEIKKDKEQLDFQKESKENLLKLTQGQESIYRQLLEQSIAEQQAMLEDIQKFSNAMTFIEQKISEEGVNFNPEDYLHLLDKNTRAVFDFKLNYDGPIGKFVWPVEPDRGISAYYRDPSYVGVFGMQHHAIDLPVYQGSPVRAAANGVVYKAKDNGYGYSYIIIAHAGGFMSVYGHMSQILVQEGDNIPQGFIIGMSGGMPGTKGAGYQTTGPHLHFEILLNGLHIDPLNYMPLEKLTLKQIEKLPEKYYQKWEQAVLNFGLMPVER